MPASKPDRARPKSSAPPAVVRSETFSDGSAIHWLDDGTMVLIEAQSPYSGPAFTTGSSPDAQTNSSDK